MTIGNTKLPFFFGGNVKVCRVCSKEGEDSLFLKTVNLCKECNRRYMQEYRKKNPDHVNLIQDPNLVKMCSKCGFEGKSILFRKGRNVCLSCVGRANRKWRSANTEQQAEYKRKSYVENREKLLEYASNYRLENAEAISVKDKLRYEAKKPEVLARNSRYRQTSAGREACKKKQSKRKRELGHEPINAYFPGSDAHHLKYTNDPDIENNNVTLYVPSDLHRSVAHNGKTGKNMKAINMVCLEWYIKETSKSECSSEAIQLYKNYCTLPEPEWSRTK